MPSFSTRLGPIGGATGSVNVVVHASALVRHPSVVQRSSLADVGGRLDLVASLAWHSHEGSTFGSASRVDAFGITVATGSGSPLPMHSVLANHLLGVCSAARADGRTINDSKIHPNGRMNLVLSRICDFLRARGRRPVPCVTNHRSGVGRCPPHERRPGRPHEASAHGISPPSPGSAHERGSRAGTGW
jgi:hypothetical protein